MRLALGTAQFGLDYGVSNSSGQVAMSEIEDILLEAKNHNINIFYMNVQKTTTR